MGVALLHISYSNVVQSLRASILLLLLAMMGSIILLGYAVQDSIRLLSIIGMWDKELGSNLWWVWPIIGLNIIVAAWAEFIFVPLTKKLFGDDTVPIERFGTSMADEAKSLADVHISLKKYAIFMMAASIAIGGFIHVNFVNIILVILLLSLQFGLLIFLREKARLLKADLILLT